MIPEEIEIGAMYRIIGTQWYVGRVEKFDGDKAMMTMITGRRLSVPWYDIVMPISNITEEYKAAVDKIYAEEMKYIYN